MLRVEDIHVYRDRTYVLQGVSLDVGHGEIAALIGANGAGKTTTLRTISGLLKPKEGHIFFRPEPGGAELEISGLQAEEIVGLGISHCPEGRGVFSQLSVRENLIVGGYLRKDKQELEKDYLRITELFPILRERSKQAAGLLSGGEQMMLAVGRALMSRPKLLIMDEPSLGLAPMVVALIFKMLEEINAQGVTILLVEQNAVMAFDLADKAFVLETGRMILSGFSRDLARDEKIRQAYLGGAA